MLVRSRRFLKSAYAGIKTEKTRPSRLREAADKSALERTSTIARATHKHALQKAIEKRLERFPRRSRALMEYLLRDASFDHRFFRLAIRLMQSTKPGQPIRKITGNLILDRKLLDNAWAMENLPFMLMQLELAQEDPRVTQSKRARLPRMRAKYHEKYGAFMQSSRAILIQFLDSMPETFLSPHKTRTKGADSAKR